MYTDWKTHATEYYECSKYKADPKIAEKTAGAKARAALEKYLFYYNRVRNFSAFPVGSDACFNVVGKPQEEFGIRTGDVEKNK